MQFNFPVSNAYKKFVDIGRIAFELQNDRSRALYVLEPSEGHDLQYVVFHATTILTTKFLNYLLVQ